MLTFNSNDELKALIKNGVLEFTESVTCKFSINVKAHIKTAGNITARNITALDITAGNITAGDITAGNITAGNITAGDITAGNITARNITAGDITAGNITAWNITAWDITAWNITAWNITAWNITARNISFYAVCFAYVSLKCRSIIGRRSNHKFGCLDKEIEYVKDETPPSLVGQEVEVKMNGKTFTAKIVAEK